MRANGVGQDAEIEPSPEADSAHFSEQLEKLGSEQFREREAALRSLLDLPVSALPWAEEKLRQFDGTTDLEIRGRLATVVASLRKQKAESLIARVFKDGAITAPFDCAVFIEPVGGTAGASSEIGLGTSPKDFRTETQIAYSSRHLPAGSSHASRKAATPRSSLAS